MVARYSHYSCLHLMICSRHALPVSHCCCLLLPDEASLPVQGVAINFVKSDDIRILRDIEQYYSTQVDEMVSSVSSTHSVDADLQYILTLCSGCQRSDFSHPFLCGCSQ